jgi:arginyl-tRNA synthetase
MLPPPLIRYNILMIETVIRQAVQQAVAEVAPGELIPSFTLEHPKEESHGDYAVNVAMQLASILRRSPLTIAQEIADKLNDLPQISRVEVAPPGFINFWLSSDWLKNQLTEITQQKDQFGRTSWGHGKTWLIEHTSPNPNKAMHLGHLRNNVTGMAIANLWEAQGIHVIRDAIDNNRGIAIARLMWGYLKFARKDESTPVQINHWYEHPEHWKTPEEANERPDRFMDKLYTLASADCKENAESEQTVRQMVVDWENKDKQNWALWATVLEYVYQGQNLTLARLGSRWDHVWHEHEHYEEGKRYVAEGLARGIFQQLDTGVILTDLEEYKLPDTVVQKSDGTSLYITQDLALTHLKKETFHPDHIYWVIGPEQSLALQQLFAVCEQLGIGEREEFTHLSFGYMSIKGQGKMSSRLGNVVYIDDLIDQAKDEVLTYMKLGDFGSEQERQDVAEQIAVGSVKYSILKVGRTTDTAFDFDTALSIEGDAGPYLQYTYARSQALERKAGLSPDETLELPEGYTYNDQEEMVLRWLYRYPEVIKAAGLQYSPNLLASYLYELAQRFNTFYNQHQVVTGDNQTQTFRLLLTRATGQVLKNGLALLGIETPQKM